MRASALKAMATGPLWLSDGVGSGTLAWNWQRVGSGPPFLIHQASRLSAILCTGVPHESSSEEEPNKCGHRVSTRRGQLAFPGEPAASEGPLPTPSSSVPDLRVLRHFWGQSLGGLQRQGGKGDCGKDQQRSF